MSHPKIPSTPISEFLATASLAPHQEHKALTLWPLVWPEGAAPSGPACVPLREALARGDVRVDEVNEDGSVPHVRLENRGKASVLFLFGEEIVGAKQNRVANATFLVPPATTIVIDVSCVEAGRWDRRGRTGFESARQVVSRELRSKMASSVRSAMASGQGFRADQGEVWDEIGSRLSESEAHSQTEAWGDYAASRAESLAEFDRAFQPVPGQVGFVAVQGGVVVGLEAVGHSAFFAENFRTLLRSYTIDAIEGRGGHPTPTLFRARPGPWPRRRPGRRSRPRRAGRPVEDAEAGRPGHDAAPQPEPFREPEAFLAALTDAPVSWAASRGIGSDLRVDTPRVSACALACEGLVHLTAFPAERASC